MAASKISDTSAEVEGVKVEEDEGNVFLKKLSKFADRNKHRKIETLGRNVIVTAGAFALLMGTTGFVAYEKSQTNLSNQAVYTTKFKTSKTNQAGTVEGVFSNKDRSRILVLMKFDDSARMSGIATNYRSFLAKANVNNKGETDYTTTAMEDRPSGSIIMFGQGYMGLYLTQAGGFHQQIVSAIMRADKQLVSTTEAQTQSTEAMDPRSSFQKFDQWEVYFNPAGKSSTHIPSLDEKNLDIGKIYYDTVAKKAEAEQRKVLDDDLVALKADLATIQDYRTRLSTTSVNGLKVKLPAEPEMVKGDEIVGKDKTPTTPSTLMLKPKKTFNNGFNFDWRKKSIQNGILDSLVPKGQNSVTWFNEHMSREAQADKTPELKWELSDGTDLSSVSTSDITSLQNLNAMVQSLTAAYSQYHDNKEKYQSTDLGKLVSLELDLNDVVQNNSINTSKKAINFYG